MKTSFQIGHFNQITRPQILGTSPDRMTVIAVKGPPCKRQLLHIKEAALASRST